MVLVCCMISQDHVIKGQDPLTLWTGAHRSKSPSCQGTLVVGVFSLSCDLDMMMSPARA